MKFRQEEFQMSNKSKVIHYIVTNGLFIAGLYSAIVLDYKWVQYAVVGFIWFEFLMLWLFVGSSKILNFLKQRENEDKFFITDNIVLRIFDITFDLVLLFVFYKNAWYLTSVIYLFHTILANYLRSAVKE